FGTHLLPSCCDHIGCCWNSALLKAGGHLSDHIGQPRIGSGWIRPTGHDPFLTMFSAWAITRPRSRPMAGQSTRMRKHCDSPRSPTIQAQDEQSRLGLKLIVEA